MRLIYEKLHLLIRPNDVSTRMQDKHFVSSHKKYQGCQQSISKCQKSSLHNHIGQCNLLHSLLFAIVWDHFHYSFHAIICYSIGPSFLHLFTSIAMFECLREREQKASRHFALTRTTNLLRLFMPYFIHIPLTFHNATCLETSAPSLQFFLSFYYQSCFSLCTELIT